MPTYIRNFAQYEVHTQNENKLNNLRSLVQSNFLRKLL